MSKTIITGRLYLQEVVLHSDKTLVRAFSAVLFTYTQILTKTI